MPQLVSGVEGGGGGMVSVVRVIEEEEDYQCQWQMHS